MISIRHAAALAVLMLIVGFAIGCGTTVNNAQVSPATAAPRSIPSLSQTMIVGLIEGGPVKALFACVDGQSFSVQGATVSVITTTAGSTSLIATLAPQVKIQTVVPPAPCVFSS